MNQKKEDIENKILKASLRKLNKEIRKLSKETEKIDSEIERPVHRLVYRFAKGLAIIIALISLITYLFTIVIPVFQRENIILSLKNAEAKEELAGNKKSLAKLNRKLNNEIKTSAIAKKLLDEREDMYFKSEKTKNILINTLYKEVTVLQEKANGQDILLNDLVKVSKKIEEIIPSEIENKLMYYHKKFKSVQIATIDKLIDTDKEGKYFRIYLEDVVSKLNIYFAEGKYVVNGFDNNFNESISSFYHEIILPLQKIGRKFKLYLTGSSDAKPCKRCLINEEFYFKEIELFPLTSEGTYSSNLSKYEIKSDKLSNNDLANLRAAFLQHKLKKVYNIETTILEGNVALQVGKEYNKVSLILYLPD